MHKILCLIFLLSIAGAEIALSLGLTQGTSMQTLSGDEQSVRVQPMSLRPAYFVEVDSIGHPLFLANDYVAYGIGLLTETAHDDFMLGDNNQQMSIPLYFTYFLRYGSWAIGTGLNLNMLQLRYKNDVFMQGQQLGGHLFLRLNGDGHFLELGAMELCAQGEYPDDNIMSFYQTTNIFLRYGFYLGKNTL